MTPDWKLDSDYDFARKIVDAREWAWQFLRRSKGYRKAWQEFQSEIAPLELLFGPCSNWIENPDAITDPRLWGFEPSLRASETIKEWDVRVFYLVGRTPIRELLPAWRARKWQLRQMYDPETTPAGLVEFHREEPPLWYTHEEISFVSEVTESFESGVYTWIDLGRPLPPQFRRLQEVLTAKQKGLKARGDVKPRRQSPKKDLWPQYLQLLDADNRGVPVEKIAASGIQSGYYSKIKKGKDAFDPIPKVRERLTTARQLAELGYRTLLLDSR